MTETKPDTLPIDPKAYMPGVAAEGDCTIDGDPLCEWCNERIDARDGGVWFHSGTDQRQCATDATENSESEPSAASSDSENSEERYCADCGAYPVDADHECDEYSLIHGDVSSDETEFFVIASMPYYPGRLDCCSSARIVVLPDLGASDLMRQLYGRPKPLASFGPDTYIVVRHIHSDSCEVSRIVP